MIKVLKNMTKYSLNEFIEYCLNNKEVFVNQYENFEIVFEIKTVDGINISRIALFNTYCLNKKDFNEICFCFEYDIEHIDGAEYNLNYFSFNVSESAEDKLNHFKNLDKELFNKQIKAVNVYIVSMIEKGR